MRRAIAIGAATVSAVLVIGGVSVAVAGSNKPTKTAGSAGSANTVANAEYSNTAEPPTTTEPTPTEPTTVPAPTFEPTTETPEPTHARPNRNSFALTLKTKSRQCFGEAGCVVEYSVKVKYAGTDVSDTDGCEITYTVAGAEDGPQLDTVTLESDGSYYGGDGVASTPSASTLLKVKINEVDCS